MKHIIIHACLKCVLWTKMNAIHDTLINCLQVSFLTSNLRLLSGTQLCDTKIPNTLCRTYCKSMDDMTP